MLGSELQTVMGHEKGARLKITSDGSIEVLERLEGNVLRARLAPGWTWVLVVTVGSEGSHRGFLLAPGEEEQQVAFGRFAVRGAFTFAKKANSRRAVEELVRATAERAAVNA